MDRAPEASSTIMSATDRRPVAGRAGEGGRGRRSVATQLAQMLAARSPTIYAFEPVPTTFAKLVQSVQRLGLNDRVHPIAAAVLDDPRQVCLSYSLKNSLYAQITPHGLNPRVGDHLAYAPGVTLDGFCSLKDVVRRF